MLLQAGTLQSGSAPAVVGDGVLKMPVGREIEVQQPRVIGRVKGEAESRAGAQGNSGRTTSIPSLQHSPGYLHLQIGADETDGQIQMQIWPVLEIFFP